MKTILGSLLVLLSVSAKAQKVFSVKYASQADVKVYVVNYESQAGWRNREKMHLMF